MVAAVVLAAVVLAAASGCGSGGDECSPTPAAAIRGYQGAAPQVETLLREALFWQAYAVLAAEEAGDPAAGDSAAGDSAAGDSAAGDAGVEQVRRRLAAEGIAPTSAARSDLSMAQIMREEAGQGILAERVADMMAQVSAAVHDHSGRLPLPDAQMRQWRDDLRRRVNDAVAEALFHDPTYRAGVEVAQPDWDGSLESLRAQPDNQNLVNAAGNEILDAVQDSLVVACKAS